MQRMTTLALALALAMGGILIVAALLLLRTDLQKATQEGPRWRRRLIAAGLGILGFSVTAGALHSQTTRSSEPIPVTSCYEAQAIDFESAASSLQALPNRIAALEQLIKSGKLHNSVIVTRLRFIDQDLVNLNDPTSLARLTDAQKTQAAAVYTQASQKLAQIRKDNNLPPADLRTIRQWQDVNNVWAPARVIADGKKGNYPFDASGKRQVLAQLDQALANIKTLQSAGLLDKSEAALLLMDLSLLRSQVDRFRTVEDQMSTCYKMIRILPPAVQSRDRLKERLDLLNAMAQNGDILPEVAALALAQTQKDLAVLDDPKNLKDKDLAAEEAKEAVDLAQKAHKAVMEIRLRAAQPSTNPATLPAEQTAPAAASDPLLTSPHWATISDAWSFAMPFALSGQSTQAQRKQVDEKLAAAETAARQLVTQNLLLQSEADLLKLEAANLKAQVYRDPPTDSKIMCYERAYLPPARQSLQRIDARLSLLQQLAADGKVHPDALAKILPTIQADLATLADKKELSKLPADERANAEKIRAQAVQAIKALSGEVK